MSAFKLQSVFTNRFLLGVHWRSPDGGTTIAAGGMSMLQLESKSLGKVLTRDHVELKDLIVFSYPDSRLPSESVEQ